MIGPTYPIRGGIAHYNTMLVKNLKKRHIVKLISFKRQYPSFIFPGKTQIDNSGYKVKVESEHIIDSMNPYTWGIAFREIKLWQPELIILHWVTIYMWLQYAIIIYLIKKYTETKVLMICHNVKQHEHVPGERWFTKIAFNNVDYFIVHSEEDRTNLKRIIPDAKIKKVFHPIYDMLKMYNITQCEAKSRLGISGNIILHFGFVRKYKGLIYLIKALPMILKEVDVKLLVVGEFWDNKQKYIDEIKRLKVEDSVIIIDKYIPNEEVELYFAAADVVVLPYVSATQSGVIQLAFGFNKPVITTNVGGLPEVVENGKTGYIVPPKDVNAIAEAIVRFYKGDKMDKFIHNIIGCKNKFSWNNMIEIIEHIDA